MQMHFALIKLRSPWQRTLSTYKSVYQKMAFVLGLILTCFIIQTTKSIDSGNLPVKISINSTEEPSSVPGYNLEISFKWPSQYCEILKPLARHFDLVSIFNCQHQMLSNDEISGALNFIKSIGKWNEIAIISPAIGNQWKVAKLLHEIATNVSVKINWMEFVLDFNKEITDSLIKSGSRIVFIAIEHDPQFLIDFLCHAHQGGVRGGKFIFITNIRNRFEIDQLPLQSKCSVEMIKNQLDHLFWFGDPSAIGNSFENIYETHGNPFMISLNEQVVYDGHVIRGQLPWPDLKPPRDAASRLDSIEDISQLYFKPMAIATAFIFLSKVILARVLSLQHLAAKIGTWSLHGMKATRIIILTIVLILDLASVAMVYKPGQSCLISVTLMVLGISMLIGCQFGILLTSILPFGIERERRRINSRFVAPHSIISRIPQVVHEEFSPEIFKMRIATLNALPNQIAQMTKSREKRLKDFVNKSTHIVALNEKYVIFFMSFVVIANIIILPICLAATSSVHLQTRFTGLESYNSEMDIFYKHFQSFCRYESIRNWFFTFASVNLGPVLAILYIGYLYLPSHKNDYERDFYIDLRIVVNIIFNLLMIGGVTAFGIVSTNEPISKQLLLSMGLLFIATSTLLVRLSKHLKAVVDFVTKARNEVDNL